MVSKTLAVVAALAMMAGSAQASMQLEHFITFANAPTADTFKLLVFYQLWAFLVPLIAGPLNVFLTYLWNNYSTSLEVDSVTITIYGYSLFGFIGIGNYDQLFELFMGLIPKAAIKIIIGMGFLGDDSFSGYGDLEVSLIEQLGQCELL